MVKELQQTQPLEMLQLVLQLWPIVASASVTNDGILHSNNEPLTVATNR